MIRSMGYSLFPYLCFHISVYMSLMSLSVSDFPAYFAANRMQKYEEIFHSYSIIFHMFFTQKKHKSAL